MRCPTCKSSTLVAADSPTLPRTSDCPTCHGQWLAFDDHLAWVSAEHTDPTPPQPAPPTSVAPAPTPRFCPRCQKFMTRYRVSADHPLTLERCGTCAGTWFDHGEFEVACALTPLSKLQHIFNDTHQHRLAHTLKARERDARVARLAGPEALKRVQDFHAWIAAHPAKDTLLAYLTDELDGPR